jgi:osmotically-inducible protein OsmY
MATHDSPERVSLDAEAEAAARTLGIEGARVFVLRGVPHIEGTAANFQLKRAAGQLITLMTGADHVVNRLRIAPREARSDRAVARSMTSAFEEALGMEAAAVRVEVNGGVVLLAGKVSSLSVRCAAEQAAWSVGGVWSVVNRLSVGSILAAASDLAHQLETDVSACLGLPPAMIAVEIKGSTALVKGSVPSPYHRLAAEDLLRAHELVKDVLNTLSVAQPAQAAPRPFPEGQARMQAS